MFRHLPRRSQRSGAPVSIAQKPAARWSSQLARRTTVFLRKGRGLSPMQCPFIALRAIAASATRRSRAISLRAFPPLERQHAQWRSRVGHANAGCVTEVKARTSHHGLARKERGLPPVQCSFISRERITASQARRARAASSRVSPPPETQPAQWRSRVDHAKTGCALEVTARTSHHGLARKDRGLSPVQCPLIARDPIAASSVRRACAASSRVSPPPGTQPAQWHSRVGHAKAGCALEVTAPARRTVILH